MRDPERIPVMASAVMAAWLKDPDQRLGQLLVNAVGGDERLLYNVEDGDLYEALTTGEPVTPPEGRS